MSYLIPGPYTGTSSRDAHLRRNPPSSEPGTDYYMPTGTPLGAPTYCRVVDIGGNVDWATGRYITLDDGTRWIRYLHNSRIVASIGQQLDPGEVFAISGASGYGSEFFGEPYRNDAFWSNTGGDHVHVTAFRGRGYTFGSSGTVDFHALTGGTAAGGFASEEDDMTPEQDRRLEAVYQALFGPANVPANTTGKITWAKPYGEKPGEAFYGLLDVAIYSQQLSSQVAGVLAALQAAVAQLSAGSGVALDMKAIEDAAERGARDALDGLTLTANTDG
ncbi:M23 family metallopeptidase [Microbacterium sp. LWH12-1.2]|uniref:M23 family metallopeptidase n=1 Tax=Microbacterium sp. LWH12-1.2 TaxID=3135259 RepID=UPI003446A300